VVAIVACGMVRVNLKVQPRRTPFDATPHQVFDRIEADYTARDRFYDPAGTSSRRSTSSKRRT
jgi:hypothetical protein